MSAPVETALAEKSMWNLRTLSEAVLAAPTDRGTINVWLARDLARATLASVHDRSPDAELCALCTPERDHNGVLCRTHANQEIARLKNALYDRSPDGLTEALRPWIEQAEHEGMFEGHWAEDHDDEWTQPPYITLGQLRTIRAALAAAGQPATKETGEE